MSDLTAIKVLEQYQKQLDPEGIEVGVSRQALDEVLQRIKELETWAETPPDNMGQFKQLWKSCVRLVEKASFKAMFCHMEKLEKRIKELEQEKGTLSKTVLRQSHERQRAIQLFEEMEKEKAHHIAAVHAAIDKLDEDSLAPDLISRDELYKAYEIILSILKGEQPD